MRRGGLDVIRRLHEVEKQTSQITETEGSRRERCIMAISLESHPHRTQADCIRLIYVIETLQYAPGARTRPPGFLCLAQTGDKRFLSGDNLIDLFRQFDGGNSILHVRDETLQPDMEFLIT